MLRDPSTENSVSKEHVAAAINSIKSKGWDVNPFTVADEMKVARTVIYQNIEFMSLIIEARGGSFGMDMDSSLTIARRIQELESYINQLQGELEQMHKQLHPQEVQEQSAYDSGAHHPQFTNQTVVTGDQDVIAQMPIFNAAQTAPVGSNQQSISELSWKELEAVYNFTAASLMDLSRRMSGEEDSEEPEILTPPTKPVESAEAAPAFEVTQEAHPPHTRTRRKRKTSHDESPEVHEAEVPPAEEIAAVPEPMPGPIHHEVAQEPAPKTETTTGDVPITHAEVESASIQADIAAASIESIPDDVLDSLSADEFAFEGEEAANKTPSFAASKSDETGEHYPIVPEHPAFAEKNNEDTAEHPAFIELEVPGHEEPAHQPVPEPVSNAVPNVEEEEEGRSSYHPAANAGMADRAMRMLNASPYDSLTNIPALEMPPSLSVPESTHTPEPRPMPEIAHMPEPTFVPEPTPMPEPTFVPESTPMPELASMPMPTSIPMPIPMPEDQIPDLENMDIFDDFSNAEALENIEVMEADVEVEVEAEAQEETPENDDAISGDELRELIKNRIKTASDHLGSDTIPPSEDGADKEEPKAGFRSKFVGMKAQASTPGFVTARVVPPEIRKSCLILGVRPEEITVPLVLDAWKKQIAAPGVHPDLGGDTESAIYLNTAKDSLVRWIEAQEPKLSKKFGTANKEKVKPDPKDKDKEKAT